MWSHYTNERAYKLITKEGFKLSKEYGRFGKAIYFTDSEDFGQFGDYKINAEIETPILKLTHKEICENIFPEYDLLEDEEGTPDLKEYVISKNYKAVSIEYSDGLKELAVYDLSAIKIKKN